MGWGVWQGGKLVASVALVGREATCFDEEFRRIDHGGET